MIYPVDDVTGFYCIQNLVLVFDAGRVVEELPGWRDDAGTGRAVRPAADVGAGVGVAHLLPPIGRRVGAVAGRSRGAAPAAAVRLPPADRQRIAQRLSGPDAAVGQLLERRNQFFLERFLYCVLYLDIPGRNL